MFTDLDRNRLAALQAYAAGQAGTRETIERAGMDDYADLVIALAQADLDFPKPAATPAHEADMARASEILQPRLRLPRRRNGG